ncbi:MAG: Nramp family divalent metal transporter [Candidatus Marinimicrobia bacterium]|nr:Nramp family divalent metal transporter [Candidatus Neomarinimicrobiota bacterium]
MKKLALFFATIAPGLFLIGYNIGTGSVTTMASAGAKYGMTMFWPLLLSIVFTYILVIAFGRYTVVTGETALFSFRKNFGTGISAFVLTSLLFSEWVSCIGVMGVVVQVVQEWSRPLTASGNGFNQVLLVFLFGGLLYILFLNGKQHFFEKILAIFVAIMGISFILTMFMVIIDPKEVITGLIPRLPSEGSAFLIIAGMVGTTMGGILYVVRSILVQEKGWGINDLKIVKRDALISVALMFVLSVAVMASAAGTLYIQGLEIDNAIDMVKLLEPLAGRFAISIFVAGIVCAGLSSLFPIILLAPWLLADYSNKPRNMKSNQTKLLVLFGVLLGFVIPVFGGRPVMVMITSQALVAMATPVVVGLMFLLLNNKKIMGKYTSGLKMNIAMVIIFLFTVLISIIGLVGIFNLL